jgi:hypothetical protein
VCGALRGVAPTVIARSVLPGSLMVMRSANFSGALNSTVSFP